MKGADLHPKDHNIQLFTDASNEGWGAHLEQTSAKGLWPDREKRLHINVLKAVSLALQRFKDQCQNQTVFVATDNSTVVAYINKQGRTHSAEMCALWELVQFSTEIPLQLPESRTLLKQSHNYLFHSNSQYLNPHAWCLGVASSKNKASLWKWQRELLPLRDHQQGPSTSQSGPYLRDGAEKIQRKLHSLYKASVRLLYVPVPRSKQAPFDH